MKFTVKKESLPESQIKLIINVDAKDFDVSVKKAKQKVLAEVTMPGFRKGHVTEDVFVKTYGSMAFRQEAAYDAVDATYVSVLVEQKIPAVGRPGINIVSFNEGEDLVYEIVVDVLPEAKVGEYKNLYKEISEKETTEISEEDIQKTLDEIISYRTTKNEDGTDNVPELTEEVIKSLGIESGNLEDLKSKIRENAKIESEYRNKEVRKNEIMEKLLANVEVETPASLVENELLKMKDKITSDLSQMGIGFPEYLKHLNKSEEEWKTSETDNAKKAVKLQLALLQIAKQEKIEVSPEALDAEVKHLKMHYKDLDENRAREYSREVMTNSLIMEFIMTGKLPDEKEFFKPDHSHDHE